jgi:hypothetical protein
MEDDTMDIKQMFAAEVFSAERNATASTAAGLPQTTSDQVDIALCNLWTHLTAEGCPRAEIQAVADKYVFWDENDQPWPRAVDPGNVTLLP